MKGVDWLTLRGVHASAREKLKVNDGFSDKEGDLKLALPKNDPSTMAWRWKDGLGHRDVELKNRLRHHVYYLLQCRLAV